jgi:hypothetical protein
VLPHVNMAVDVQLLVCSAGVFFERCLLVSLVKERPVPLSAMAHAIRKTGVKRNILATDLGQADNISPVDGMRYFINEMLDLGFSQEEINWVSKVIPAQLLDLG